MCTTLAPKEGEESCCVECVKTRCSRWYHRPRYNARTTRQVEVAEVYKGWVHTSSSHQCTDRAQFLYPFRNLSGKSSNPDNLGIFTVEIESASVDCSRDRDKIENGIPVVSVCDRGKRMGNYSTSSRIYTVDEDIRTLTR